MIVYMRDFGKKENFDIIEITKKERSYNGHV